MAKPNDGTSDSLPSSCSFPVSPEFLDQLAEPVYVVKRTDGAILHANESARTRNPEDSSDPTGRSYPDDVPGSPWNDWETLLARLDESSGERLVRDGVSAFPFRDGEENRVLILESDPAPPDPSAQDKDALKRYRDAFNSAFEFRGVMDSDGRILEFNVNAREFLDLEHDELQDRPYWELDAWSEGGTPPDVIKDMVDRVREGESLRRVVTVRDGEDRERYIDLALSPNRGNDGTVRRILGEGRDVTELLEKDRELEEQKWRLQSIAENIDEGIWMYTADWAELLFVNERQYESIWGGCADRLREEPGSFIENVHPDDRAGVLEAMDSLSEGNDREIEVRVNASNDYETWVSINGYYQETEDPHAKDRVLGTVRDVTDIVETYEELVEQEQRFREMAETINEVFWVTDPHKAETIYVSPAFEDIWGYEADDLYEDPQLWVEAIHPEDRPRIQRLLPEAQLEGDYDEEYRIRTASDELRWIHDKAFPIREDGEVVRVLGVAEDITKRVERERETRKKEKLASVGEMAAGVMHEINNPNAFIQGNVEFLRKAWETVEPHFSELSLEPEQRENLREEIPQVLESMRGGTRRIEKIVDNVKRFARESQEESTPHTYLTNPCDRLYELVEDLRTHRKRDVNLVDFACDTPGEVPVPLTEEDFETVVLNLIDNALDAMEGTEDPEFSVGLSVRDDQLYFWVQDNGEGIEDEHRSKITDPFFSTKSKAEGTGLGLSIVATIVDRAEGELSLDSEPGLGTLVEVRVPTLD